MAVVVLLVLFKLLKQLCHSRINTLKQNNNLLVFPRGCLFRCYFLLVLFFLLSLVVFFFFVVMVGSFVFVFVVAHCVPFENWTIFLINTPLNGSFWTFTISVHSIRSILDFGLPIVDNHFWKETSCFAIPHASPFTVPFSVL